MRKSTGPWAVAATLIGAMTLFVIVAHATTQVPAPEGQYTISADNLTVQDNRTGLIWQRQVPDSPCGTSTCTLAAATTYCGSLNGANFGGFSFGWRLPTIKELQSIVNRRAYNPAIDAAAFGVPPIEVFWSSSPYIPWSTSGAWGVSFFSGSAFGAGTSSSYRVRCVRSFDAQP